MTEMQLSGRPETINLGRGFELRTGALTGTVRIEHMEGARAFGSDPLDAALAKAGLRPGPVIQLPAAAAPGAARAIGTQSADSSSVALDVEVAGDESCALLVEDRATGALSWVVPDGTTARGTEGSRALSTSLRFTIPLASAAQPEGARAFFPLPDLGKKVEPFFFKMTDVLLGPIIHGFAKKWETKNRPCFTRRFGPDDYRNDSPSFPSATRADWQALSQGPALLFVHGTFSTSGAFQAIEPATMNEVSRRYGGRTFAFNHPTMTADPRENAIAFLADIPEGILLEIDIVCHSRGGLVARQIAALGQAAGKVRVRRIVFVGATNAGTLLADEDHMIDMVSRFTTIAKLIPTGPVRTSVDALVLVVKVLGHGLLHDLEGLAAMNPKGNFLEAMNVPGAQGADYFAIASDFEPKAGTPFFSLRRAEDLTADSIFGHAANDLVVPQEGVFAKNGAGGFPITEARCLRFGPSDGVIHTEFFGEPRVQAKLLEWLEPAAANDGARALGMATTDIARVLDTVRDRLLLELAPSGGSRALGSREADLTPAELDALRPHILNLSEGVFKQSGIYSTTAADVDAMVREHIPRWTAALPQGQPLRVVVWAHGGLIGERDGLRIAHKHIEWWKQNGVYPIYFVWETGLFDALRSILESVRRKLPGVESRDLFDFTSDPIVQAGVRAMGGVHIWGAMKRNAELACNAGGGARYVAERLAELSTQGDLRAGRDLHLHAVGHSAGAIFHSHFLPVARQSNVPSFRTLQLLAPAVTIAEFQSRLGAEIGGPGAAERAIIYTMKRHFEEDDDCISVYRKSLLYLIHHALEPDQRTPLLGLEISLRADSSIASLFGLNGAPNAAGRVVWSRSDETDGRFASRATTHGGFDDDPATMNSVAANVLDEAVARVQYTGDGHSRAQASDGWPISDQWLAGVDVTGGFAGTVSAAAAAAASKPSMAMPLAAATRPTVAAKDEPSRQGSRRALCVGIDDYPGQNALRGCVNDTRTWSAALSSLGFEAATLTDSQATRQGILDALRTMLRGAGRGDVLVFHYSGHGCQVPDYDGDEDDGNDEALVPIDFEGGAFLIDDDLRAVFAELPAGVNLTCFTDCCHSGTITRMLGRKPEPGETDARTRTRYLKRSASWQDWMRAHERFRQRDRAVRSAGGASRALDGNALRWVNFSACHATEVAYENEGSGDFTRKVTALLNGDLLKRSNREVQDAIIAAFGERRRQTPQLDCADAARALNLFSSTA
ncbi:caspase family protein [Variovorax sp. LjRoot84]|uniref:DUF7379 domain-containing protein n=1 Tax=Variovorax sp. LjRoot84 TaxID=3342340 RepID=UPI003ECC6DC3